MKSLAPILFSLATITASVADEAALKADLMQKGQANYATCIACHGPDGKGVQAGPSLMAPAFEGSKLATGNPKALAKLLLKGIAKEDQKYLGMMAPMEAVLNDDEKLASIMTYVRNSYGNTASVVTVEQAKAFREEFKDIKAPVPRAELEKLSAE